MSDRWAHTLQSVAALTAVGVGAVVFAAVSLAREALLSLRIISLHFDELESG